MAIWPTPIPQWFWQWAQWYLGREEYKGLAKEPELRPENAPDKIPYWAWARLAVMMGRPVPKPPIPIPPAPQPPKADPGLVVARHLLAHCRKYSGSYLYGGGHGKRAAQVEVWHNLDCSSSTSAALDQFDLLEDEWVHVSGWFEKWGESGRGKWVTVHANFEHVWIEFNLPEGWFRFDTSPHGEGPRGPRVRTRRRFDSSFAHRHPPGM